MITVSEKTKVGLNEQDLTFKVLSNVFAIWTLNQSEAYFNADHRLDNAKRKQLLKYPHPA